MTSPCWVQAKVRHGAMVLSGRDRLRAMPPSAASCGRNRVRGALFPHLDQQPRVVARSPFLDPIESSSVDGFVEASGREHVIELQPRVGGRAPRRVVRRHHLRIRGPVLRQGTSTPTVRGLRPQVYESKCFLHSRPHTATACHKVGSAGADLVAVSVAQVEITSRQDPVWHPVGVGDECRQIRR